MLKQLIQAGILTCLCGSAHATATWNFQYQGFLDTRDGLFHAERKVNGSFIGGDWNANGIVERSEITSLVLNGVDYVICEPATNAYYVCSIEAFTFSTAGGLTFTAGERGKDPEGLVGGGHYFVAGEGEYHYRFRPGFEENYSYRWTPETTFTITAVPEPSTWAMLGAGLLLTAAAVRRARRA